MLACDSLPRKASQEHGKGGSQGAGVAGQLRQLGARAGAVAADHVVCGGHQHLRKVAILDAGKKGQAEEQCLPSGLAASLASALSGVGDSDQ